MKPAAAVTDLRRSRDGSRGSERGHLGHGRELVEDLELGDKIELEFTGADGFTLYGYVVHAPRHPRIIIAFDAEGMGAKKGKHEKKKFMYFFWHYGDDAQWRGARIRYKGQNLQVAREALLDWSKDYTRGSYSYIDTVEYFATLGNLSGNTTPLRPRDIKSTRLERQR